MYLTNEKSVLVEMCFFFCPMFHIDSIIQCGNCFRTRISIIFSSVMTLVVTMMIMMSRITAICSESKNNTCYELSNFPAHFVFVRFLITNIYLHRVSCRGNISFYFIECNLGIIGHVTQISLSRQLISFSFLSTSFVFEYLLHTSSFSRLAGSSHSLFKMKL